jgi:hypothetical protein
MDAYSAEVRCQAGAGRYSSTLNFSVDAGTVKSFEWRSRVEPGGHVCALSGVKQQGAKGGLVLAAGKCRVVLRDLGEYVKAAAQDCAEVCGSQAYLEPLLVDRRGNCRLLQPEAR